jgi:quercetin dioxygenase-like cupin family protein
MTESAFATWQLRPGPAAPPVVGDGATLRQVQVAAGRVATSHSHDHEQFLLVTAGSGTLKCAAGEITLAPGVVVHLPAGAWHSANFVTDTVLVEVNLAETEP